MKFENLFIIFPDAQSWRNGNLTVLMIEENSGKFFRFKLDFGLGFGFAEAYDFTDIHSADGSIVFVYNRIDEDLKKHYNLTEITASGIALGPIRLYSFPNSRGKGAWKYLFKHDDFIIDEPNIAKELQEFAPYVYDWNTLKSWYRSNQSTNGLREYVSYNEVRTLETRIMNTSIGIVKKTTMKKLIDEGKNVSEYYDLTEVGNLHRFLELINTYYPLEKTKELIKQIPLDI